MTKEKKTNTVNKEKTVDINPGDVLLSMTPTDNFFFKQDFSVPVAVGASDEKLNIQAIEDSLLGAFITGLKLMDLNNTGADTGKKPQNPKYTVYFSSSSLSVTIKDGKVYVIPTGSANDPLMVKDSSITGMLAKTIDVVLVCHYMGFATAQHFQITLEEILESAK